MIFPYVPGDRDLALCELSNDIFFRKIPADRLAVFVERPLAIGRSTAEKYAGADLGELYRRRGIEIAHRTDGARLGVTLRGLATMNNTCRRVEIYESSLRELVRHGGGGVVPDMDFGLAVKVHLAHEFFHFLEFDGECAVAAELGEVETFRFLGLVRRATIHAASEVAAHAFAKEYAGLPYLPNLFDYLYLMQTGKLRPESFADRLVELRSLVNPAPRR